MKYRKLLLVSSKKDIRVWSISVCLVTLSCISLKQTARAEVATFAHWSFDAASLSFDLDGNITGASDTTGNHNAVNTEMTGSGTGSPYTSTTIPGSASAVGQFGEGLTLMGNNNLAGGGGNFLTFPNLTELMVANGAPSYTVSYWLKTTTLNSHQFTVLSDWGNAASNPGRFTYGFGFQISSGVAQMRGQSRFNTSGSGNGTDIFARAVTTESLNDGEWHMLTWTFNTLTGTLNSYFDGSMVQTFNSAAASFQMVDSSSPLGTFGLKGDSGNFINGVIALDEVWVIGQVLPQEGIDSLFQNNLPIPEPGTMAFGALGALILTARARRRF